MVVLQAGVRWTALYVKSILRVYTYNSGTISGPVIGVS